MAALPFQLVLCLHGERWVWHSIKGVQMVVWWSSAVIAADSSAGVPDGFASSPLSPASCPGLNVLMDPPGLRHHHDLRNRGECQELPVFVTSHMTIRPIRQLPPAASEKRMLPVPRKPPDPWQV